MQKVSYSYSINCATNTHRYHAAWVKMDGKPKLMFQGYEVDDKYIPGFPQYTKKGSVFFSKPPPCKNSVVTFTAKNMYSRLALPCVSVNGNATLLWRGVHYHVVEGMDSWNQVISKDGNFCLEIPVGTKLTRI